jgi:twitching motility protein PilT
MKEVVLGVGQQSSLWSIVQIADEQLRSIHGSPRRMIARSRGVEIEAARPQFEGEFQAFTLRFPQPGAKLKESISGFLPRSPVACEVVEDNGSLVLRCNARTAEQATKVHEACDELSKTFVLPEVWRIHGEEYRTAPLSPEALFKAMARFKASDIHLCPGATPVFRVDNVLRRVQAFEPMSSEQILNMIEEIAPEKHSREFLERQQCSFIYHQVGVGYARVSAFFKAGVPHCTMRFLPEAIPSFEELNIPRDTMEALGNLHFGLVLVTGMTGSGKSTTVASLVDWINANKSLHILCIEEPVEFVHKGKKSVVSQRDVGEDIGSFHDAVRGALRHDPDAIVIGEMRDPDTIRSAINAAATGHLVISTLHSGTAYEVVNRIVSFFDPVERDLVKLQLRDALKCVICQRLVPRVGGGRQPALEFLFNDTKPVSDCILSGNTIGIKIGMQQESSRSFIFEKYLYDLLKREAISVETARSYASEPAILDQMRLGTYAIPSLDSMLHHGHR